MATRKPTPQTRTFGAEISRLREEAGIGRTELAKRIPVSRSYVGQIEGGATRCRREMAERIDDALGTGTAAVDAWDEILKTSGYPGWFRDWTRAEQSAVFLRAFETTLVYGLVQSPGYARVLLPREVDYEGRMRRQGILRRDDPPALCVVLEETTLLRQVGSPEIMREQCEHLIKVAEWDNVTLQIAKTAYFRGVHASFTLATLDNGDDVVWLTTLNGGQSSAEPADTLHASKSFALLQSRALSVDDSLEYLRKVVRDKWT